MMLLKTGRWCTLSSFESWKSEVGNDGLLPSILPLCQPISDLLAPPSAPKPVDETPEAPAAPGVIDLTLSDDDEEEGGTSTMEPGPGPSTYSQPPLVKTEDPIERIINNSGRDDLDLSWFCESDENMTIQELLNRMTVEQLKGLAKQNKCTPTGKGVKVSTAKCCIKIISDTK
jgi:fanconi-associated nuclease 1